MIEARITALHVITTIDRGGAEKQLLILAKKQVNRGIKVVIIPLKGGNELLTEFQNAGCTVILACQHKLPLNQAKWLYMFFRRGEYDEILIHAHLPLAEILSKISKKPNQRLVISRHNTEKFIPFLPNFISSAISRSILDKCWGVIAISNSVRTYLNNSKEAKLSTKVFVVPYGIDFATDLEPKRKPKTIPIKKIGTISRLVKQKNLETLLYAFAKYKITYQDSELTIIGRGPDKKKLVKLANKLSLFDSIIWLDNIQNIQEYISDFDVFVLTSLYEGFGLVYLEAMVAQVPIVSSRNNTALEIFGESANNLFELENSTDLAYKLLELNSENIRIENLLSSKKIIPKYSSILMEEKIYNIYIQNV